VLLICFVCVSVCLGASGDDIDAPRYTVFYPLKLVGSLAISFYRRVITKQDTQECQFNPSCSAFGKEAVERYGFFLGSIMAADRLLRCNPFARGSYYPVDTTGHLTDPVEDHNLFKALGEGW